MNVEQALLNTVIAFKLMSYSYSLKSFFKDEFKQNNCYIIPFSYVLHFKRNVYQIIRDSCDYVCPKAKQCDGHRFLDFVESLYEFEKFAVIDEKCFFRNFRFYNFKTKEEDGILKIDGWDFNSYEYKNLSHLTFSQRCQYLN